MLQQFLNLVFRVAAQKPMQAAGQRRSLPMDAARPAFERPTAEFLADVLRSALTQRNAESRGGRAMDQSPHEPASKPAPQDAEQPDGKVVRPMPRRCCATERASSSPTPGDDNDPGPSAA
jgi:hypothetical protein